MQELSGAHGRGVGAGRTAAKTAGWRFGTARGAAGHAGAGSRAGGAGGVSVFDHQIDRHLALERSDVALAEVVAQFMYLGNDKKRFVTIDKHTYRYLEKGVPAAQ